MEMAKYSKIIAINVIFMGENISLFSFCKVF